MPGPAVVTKHMAAEAVGEQPAIDVEHAVELALVAGGQQLPASTFVARAIDPAGLAGDQQCTVGRRDDAVVVQVVGVRRRRFEQGPAVAAIVRCKEHSIRSRDPPELRIPKAQREQRPCGSGACRCDRVFLRAWASFNARSSGARPAAGARSKSCRACATRCSATRRINALHAFPSSCARPAPAAVDGLQHDAVVADRPAGARIGEANRRERHRHRHRRLASSSCRSHRKRRRCRVLRQRPDVAPAKATPSISD